MNLNSDDILNKWKLYENDFINQMPTIEQECALQIKEEAQLLTNFTACPINKNIIPSHLNTIDPRKVKELLTDSFWDKNVLDVAACVADSIFMLPTDNATNEKIKRYISKLRQIGTESVGGYALLSNLNNPNLDIEAEQLFVIKAPRSLTTANDLVHECFIGFFGTNKLREVLSNFSYIYAMFNCSSPELNNRMVNDWCIGQGVDYVVYENVTNPISFADWLMSNDCSYNTYINYLAQIVLSLKYANDTVGFTHNDLHGQNVLLRKLDKPTQVMYPYKNGFKYILTNAIPTFIDYGRSHIRYNNKDFGHCSSDAPVPGYYKNNNNILLDIYKFMGFSLLTLKIAKPFIFNQLKVLFTYFYPVNNINDIDDILQKHRSIYYNLPPDNMNDNFDIDNFLNWCSNVFKLNIGQDHAFNNTPTIKSVINNENNINIVSSKMGMVLTDGINPSNDIYMLYDTLNSLQKTNTTQYELVLLSAKNHLPIIIHNEKSRLKVLYNVHIDESLNFKELEVADFSTFILRCRTMPALNINSVIKYLDIRKTTIQNTIITRQLTAIIPEFQELLNMYLKLPLLDNYYNSIVKSITYALHMLVPNEYQLPIPQQLTAFIKNNTVEYDLFVIRFKQINNML
jgi:hypothetical protein